MSYDALNDPPVTDAERESWRREHQPCPECRREPWKGHWPWCSKAERVARERYSDFLQRMDYRRQARELGCTCPTTLDPHTHREDCPLWRSPEEWREHLAEEAEG